MPSNINMEVQPLTQQAGHPPCTQVLGAPVHIVDIETVLRLMEQWIREHDRPHWIAVTGSHGALEAHRHPDFRAVLHTADLSVPDGRWAARFAAKKMSCSTHQVRGADLLSAFCDLSRQKGFTNYFYGDTDETLALASDRLRQKYPGVRIIGAYSPPFRNLTPDEDAQVIAMINQANPDVLWVALGLPKQERWIVAHRDRLKTPVIVAVGAALKFHSGKVVPAPRWASQAGLEWLWRLWHEPRTVWRRAMIYGPQFMALSWLDVMRHKMRRHEAKVSK
ncbi:MAG TPA: WecB/TagA/CpsF family glycosyltransferase [Terriglobia bacterium]|nr:WecB/TagA/CpsF family glycosyltransferase [Terriglobia bacterium]